MTSQTNRAVLERFYSSFQTLDADGMNSCYADGIRFRDPVFRDLEGDRVRGMWKMLAGGSRTLKLSYEIGEVGESEGDATWVASYTFPNTGNHVENHVSSHFWFSDGKIHRQLDTFDLYKWASMALGLQGRLLGWLPPVQSQISAQARSRLDKFLTGSEG